MSIVIHFSRRRQKIRFAVSDVMVQVTSAIAGWFLER